MPDSLPDHKLRVAFQGEAGAYSDIASEALFPQGERLPCASFEEALARLEKGEADYAVIPVTNSTAGPVTTAIELLKAAAAIGVEKMHWQQIHHCLLALPGTKAEDVRSVHSHWQALAQCKENIGKLAAGAVEEDDTAGAARMIAAQGDKAMAAIASARAAEVYGLSILSEGFEDAEGNKTLFLALAKDGGRKAPDVLRELKLI